MNPTTEPRYRRRRFYQVLLECVLTLGAVELGFAIFHPVPYSIESNMYFEADPYTGYRLKPGGVGHYQMSIPAVANSHGHRDVEVPLKKPSGVFRILVLSDSFTVGANVRGEEACRKITEKLQIGAVVRPNRAARMVNTCLASCTIRDKAFQKISFRRTNG